MLPDEKNHHQHRPSSRPAPFATGTEPHQTEKAHSLSTSFSAFAAKAAHLVGSPYAFLAAITIVAGWAIVGPMFHFSDTWQLIINTGTTIVTFLMVFLIQNTQNRDAKAIHLKLNELVFSLKSAHNELIEVERLSDEELEKLEQYYNRVRAESDRRDRSKNKVAS